MNESMYPIEILLVEDNPQDAEFITRALMKHNLANHLFVVEDGADAIDYIFSQGKYQDRDCSTLPKVILLDIKLPKVNGLEVLKKIKTNQKTQGIPVVMVTSSREDPDIQRAYELGANSYVVKPVAFEAFVNAMSHLGFYWLIVNQAVE